MELQLQDLRKQYGTKGVYNLILFLLPYRSTMPEFSKYISYQFGGLVFDALTLRAIFYEFFTVVMLPFAGLGFKKHQVAKCLKKW